VPPVAEQEDPAEFFGRDGAQDLAQRRGEIGSAAVAGFFAACLGRRLPVLLRFRDAGGELPRTERVDIEPAWPDGDREGFDIVGVLQLSKQGAFAVDQNPAGDLRTGARGQLVDAVRPRPARGSLCQPVGVGLFHFGGQVLQAFVEAAQ